MRRLLAVIFAWLIPACAVAAPPARSAPNQLPAVEPRVILGIYDAKDRDTFEASYLYEMAEFPLNHLGLELEYHNALKPLPDLSQRAGVRGVLIWLIDAETVDGDRLADFVEKAASLDIPVLVAGVLPSVSRAGKGAPNDRILAALGLRNLGGFRPYTYDMKAVQKDAAMVEFERKLSVPLAAVDIVKAASPQARSYLTLQRGDDPAGQTLAVATTTKGGYVAPGYISYEDKTADWKAWRINPFSYFREVFRTETLPVADTTTIAGRRIYYSHIDGDGWNSVTEVDAYAKSGTYASEVILREIALKYPDLPITVAPIAADLDPAWMGTPKAQSIARDFFRLPHIEAGSHTYTHPFEWMYFGPGYNPQSELHFVGRYVKSKVAAGIKPDPKAPKRKLSFTYDVPRAYGDIPFSVGQEVGGSIAFIEKFLAPGKRVELMQWSGDTLTFPAVMEASAKAGVPNINGRGSRFDGDFPSYANVAPVGLRVGDFVRVYASHANENEYTALWQGRYFGFRYLTRSLENTETPRRVKPANVYYHMYSGEKPAALTALSEIMAYVRTQSLAPITASRYARIGKGFFSARFVRLGPNFWRVEDRGALDTIRFDDAAALSVDYARSKGVIGHRRTQGSLYLALDSADVAPVIALTKDQEQPPSIAFLRDARWRVHTLTQEGRSLTFRAEGFGEGEMSWRVRAGGMPVSLAWRDARGKDHRVQAFADQDGIVTFRLPSIGFNNIYARLTPADLRANAQ